MERIVHRVNMPHPEKALVMNWVSPIPEYFYNGEAQDLTVAKCICAEHPTDSVPNRHPKQPKGQLT